MTCSCGASGHKDGEWQTNNIGIGESGFCMGCGDKLCAGGTVEPRAELDRDAGRFRKLAEVRCAELSFHFEHPTVQYTRMHGQLKRLTYSSIGAFADDLPKLEGGA